MLKLNPIDIVKIFKENEFRNKEHVNEYISKVATEASKIADAWEKIVQDLVTSNAINSSTEKFVEQLCGQYLFCNGIPYNRLVHFYRNASTSIGSKMNSTWAENMYSIMGRILLNRKYAKENVENLIHNFKNSRAFLKETADKQINDLIDTVQIIRQEAEALYVLSESLKLKNLN